MRVVILALAVLAPSLAIAKDCDRLQFSLPSLKESQEWGDMEYEEWESRKWQEYCSPKLKSDKLAAALRAKRANACKCAK